MYVSEHSPSLKQKNKTHPNFQGWNGKSNFLIMKGHLNHSPELEFLYDDTVSTTLAGMGKEGDPLTLVQLWTKDFFLFSDSPVETKLGNLKILEKKAKIYKQ